MDKLYNLIFNITFHCSILIVFLSLFYWNFAKKKEEHGLEYILTGGHGIIKNILEKPYINVIKGLINTRLVNNPSISNWINKSDDEIKKNNKKYIIINIAVIICLFSILLLITVFFIKKKINIKYLQIIIENIIVLTLVGLIEYYFFINVAIKYQPINDDEVLNYTIDVVLDELQI